MKKDKKKKTDQIEAINFFPNNLLWKRFITKISFITKHSGYIVSYLIPAINS